MNDLVGEQVGFDRRNAVAGYTVDRVELADQVEKRIGAPLAEVADIDSGDHYLAGPLGGRVGSLRHEAVD